MRIKLNSKKSNDQYFEIPERESITKTKDFSKAKKIFFLPKFKTLVKAETASCKQLKKAKKSNSQMNEYGSQSLENPEYFGIRHCASRILKEEGPRAFYKGRSQFTQGQYLR